MRARNLKPAFFKNEDLAELPFEYRLLFQGLWCIADREGRLEDRPKRIKAEVFPFDSVDVDAGLTALVERGLIVRYEVDCCKCIHIPSFLTHNHPHRNEKNSELPKCPDIALKLREKVRSAPVITNTRPAESPLLNPESPLSESPKASGKPTRVLFDPESVEFPAELQSASFKVAWSEWVAYRRERKASLTERSVNKQLADLARAGPVAAVKAIDKAIASGWQGLFPESVNGNGHKRTERSREPWEDHAAGQSHPSTSGGF